MRTTIGKWGNSLALRIPSSFAQDARLSDGTEVEISVRAGRLVIEAVEPTEIPLEELLARITPENLHREQHAGRARGAEEW